MKSLLAEANVHHLHLGNRGYYVQFADISLDVQFLDCTQICSSD